MCFFEDQLSLDRTLARELFYGKKYPYEVLADLKGSILSLGDALPTEIFEKKGEGIWIAKSATVAPTAFIGAPCIIDENAEVRHCAFIRGSAVIGKGAVVGNSTEIKNSVLFDCVQVPHYNYVGDSVLGYRSHLGAGAITSNVKSDKSTVFTSYGGERFNTGVKKLGAVLGDYAEIGCGCVLNPGAVVSSRSTVYPLSSVRGFIGEGMIYKNEKEIVTRLL